MQRTGYAAALFAAAVLLCAGHAQAANVCQTQHAWCATTMPVGGYCECRSHGVTEDGSVVPGHQRHGKSTASAGCSAHSHAPGCH
jgi:hypothetical protein